MLNLVSKSFRFQVLVIISRVLHALLTLVENIDEWVTEVQELQDVEINFPVVADTSGEISRTVR